METKETTIRKFELGHKVQLKTGGPMMLVDSYDGDHRVVCVWYEQSPNPPYPTNFKSHSFLEGNLCENAWKLRELEIMAKEM